MLPALTRSIQAPTRGDQMQMGMVLAIAPMRVEHHNVAPPECLAPDCAIEIIQTLHPAAHERTQQGRRVLIEGRAEHGWNCEDEMTIDHPLMQHPAHLAHPSIDVHL